VQKGLFYCGLGAKGIYFIKLDSSNSRYFAEKKVQKKKPFWNFQNGFQVSGDYLD
jgi:hypothetical protein